MFEAELRYGRGSEAHVNQPPFIYFASKSVYILYDFLFFFRSFVWLNGGAKSTPYMQSTHGYIHFETCVSRAKSGARRHMTIYILDITESTPCPFNIRFYSAHHRYFSVSYGILTNGSEINMERGENHFIYSFFYTRVYDSYQCRTSLRYNVSLARFEWVLEVPQ